MTRPPQEPFRPSELLGLLVVVVAITLWIDLAFFGSTLEDAFITFRYAERLADGHPLGTWNLGAPPVEGFTSFLWTLLLGGAGHLGLPVPIAAKALGVGAHVALAGAFVVAGRGAKDGGVVPPNAFPAAGVALALYAPLAWYASTGMEVTFFALLGTLGLVLVRQPRPGALALVAAALVLTRPEGVLLVMLLALLHHVHHRGRGWTVPAGAAGLALVGLEAFRLARFGELLPNTYYAKAGSSGFGHMVWGAEYLALAFVAHLALLPLLGWLVVRDRSSLRPRRERPSTWELPALLLYAAIIVAYVLKVGGDNKYAFPYWRHLLHASPVLALAGATLLCRWVGSRWRQVGLAAALALLTNVATAFVAGGEILLTLQRPELLAPSLVVPGANAWEWRLAELASHGPTTIATSAAGRIPYYADAHYIDLLGLNDPHIAKEGAFGPGGPPDSKTDMPWVMAQRPDVIEGYFPTRFATADADLADYIAANWRRRMHVGLLASPIFLDEYLFVQQWPYPVIDRSLFVHRTFLEGLPPAERPRLDAVPVTQTAFGRVGQRYAAGELPR